MDSAYRNERVNINEASKNQICEQLYNVIEGLSASQTSILLLQALSLTGDEKNHNQVSSIQTLSKRELEVLVLVANGYNRKSIGSSLGISVNTASRHIANIYSKLGISTVAEATSFAYACNVISSPLTAQHGAVAQ